MTILGQLFGIKPELWQEEALCSQADPEAWYPPIGGDTKAVKQICVACGVRQQCLEYAITHGEEYGIWGGLSARDRRRVKRGQEVSLIKPKPPKPPHGLTGLAKLTTERPCAHCGEEFLGKTTGKYCGPQCKRLAERDRYNRSRRKKDAA